MELQAKKKSFWGTFKNAYLKSRNLKRFWKNLDKKNLSNELINTFDIYLNSESYNWSAKIWRHTIMNHLKLMSKFEQKNYENLIMQEYFTFTYFDEKLIKDACAEIENKTIKLNVNLFKKQNNFTLMQSVNHNLILLMLYENIKNRNIFKYLNKIRSPSDHKPSLIIDGNEITQDNINSLFEYEQIEMLLGKIEKKNNIFLEVGSGSGRTAKSILSIKNDVKYVIADIPPAINICLNNLKSFFKNKKISTAFEINDPNELDSALKKNDVLFIFPHQIKLFPKKKFDVAIAIDCLHEMEKKIIKKYMTMFEETSKLLYFKVFENSGLAYSFYENHSVHNNEDYSINEKWTEHLKKRCLYPSSFFELGYELNI